MKHTILFTLTVLAIVICSCSTSEPIDNSTKKTPLTTINTLYHNVHSETEMTLRNTLDSLCIFSSTTKTSQTDSFYLIDRLQNLSEDELQTIMQKPEVQKYIPSIDTMQDDVLYEDGIADILGAVEASIEYRNCVRYGIR